MLTRLKVNGFKNLVDVDIRFGPFTCIAGANGVGKSNLFDAIRFLSMLADGRSLIEAGMSVRDGTMADVRSMFHRSGDRHEQRMSFEAEMIVPPEGEDDLGQRATASSTFLRYSLKIAYRNAEGRFGLGEIKLEDEDLVSVKQGKASSHLLFPHSDAWLKSAVRVRRTLPFITTEAQGDERVVKLFRDLKSGRAEAGRTTTHA